LTTALTTALTAALTTAHGTLALTATLAASLTAARGRPGVTPLTIGVPHALTASRWRVRDTDAALASTLLHGRMLFLPHGRAFFCARRAPHTVTLCRAFAIGHQLCTTTHLRLTRGWCDSLDRDRNNGY